MKRALAILMTVVLLVACLAGCGAKPATGVKVID